jgi:hypothetical protein
MTRSMIDEALLIVVGLPARRHDRQLVIVEADVPPPTVAREGRALGRYAQVPVSPGTLVDVYA